MQASLSAETLQVFTALTLLRKDWAGTLLLGVGLRESGCALAMASLAVGAAGLFMEKDVSVLRIAQRSGCCTFVVTTLDEALRALKNEIRQGRAITVGLGGDPGRWIAEIEERGVLPAMVAAEATSAMPRLIAWGAQPVHGFGLAQLVEGSFDLHAVLQQATAGWWALEDDRAASVADRRARDSALAAEYAGDNPVDAAMRRWLRLAPSLFPRDTTRSRWIAAG